MIFVLRLDRFDFSLIDKKKRATYSMEVAQGTSDSLNAEPRTDPMELVIEFKHFDAKGNRRSFRTCTDEPKANKCFVNIACICRMIESLDVACFIYELFCELLSETGQNSYRKWSGSRAASNMLLYS
jgi:hypothetical protein